MPLQVTRANFAAGLAALEAVLARGEFVAFDCEMTGLYLAGQEDYAVDDIEDRYLKAAAAAEAFTVTQLGLSVWAWDDAAGCFEATSFNFTLFPAAAPPEHDTRFLCQASSLAFLASQGFDFNRVRWVRWWCKHTAAALAAVQGYCCCDTIAAGVSVAVWLCGPALPTPGLGAPPPPPPSLHSGVLRGSCHQHAALQAHPSDDAMPHCCL